VKSGKFSQTIVKKGMVGRINYNHFKRGNEEMVFQLQSTEGHKIHAVQHLHCYFYYFGKSG